MRTEQNTSKSTATPETRAAWALGHSFPLKSHNDDEKKNACCYLKVVQGRFYF